MAQDKSGASQRGSASDYQTAPLIQRLEELLARNEESRPGVRNFAMAIHSTLLREIIAALKER